MPEPTILLQSMIASSILNVESKRFRNVPRDTRSGEGWTEAWGSPASNETSKQDEDDLSRLCATPYPQDSQTLTLVQYRPAWLEQFVLAMVDLPFVVVNAPYLATEATGPLPFLQDLADPSMPVRVGRAHPRLSEINASYLKDGLHANDNGILHYLYQTKGIRLDEHVTDPTKRALSRILYATIHNELNPILEYLRYEDYDSWEQVYRRQCLEASCPYRMENSSRTTSWSLSQLGGRFQAWAERAMARKGMGRLRDKSLDQVLAIARDAYSALEAHLAGKEDHVYILGYSKPSFVDAVVCDHLAQALCDVHLIIILADYPLLVRYFQRMYEHFLANTSNDLKAWNYDQNCINPFQRLPMEEHKKFSARGKYKDAIELMQSLSVHQHELQEVLLVAKRVRQDEPWPPAHDQTKSTWYRWRMGDGFEEAKEEADEPSPLRKKLLRDQIRNDQLWLSGALGFSALALFFLRSTPPPSKGG